MKGMKCRTGAGQSVLSRKLPLPGLLSDVNKNPRPAAVAAHTGATIHAVADPGVDVDGLTQPHRLQGGSRALQWRCCQKRG